MCLDGREKALRHAVPCVGGNDAGHLSPYHRRYAAHVRRQYRPWHRQSSAAGGHFTAGAGNSATAVKPRMTDFKPYVGHKRKSGTGCISQINEHLFEGRYSPTWIDGKKHARNVYAHTREECEEKLKVLIAEMKAELAELKRQKGDGH